MGRDVYWTMDYPRSDRHLLAGIRRLTRVDTKSVEQVVELDGSDDIFNYGRSIQRLAHLYEVRYGRS